MKRIYFLLFIMNVLVTGAVSAQRQWCNTDYTIDTIAYNPVIPYNSGTPVLYNVIANPLESIVDSLSNIIPIGFNFNYYGNDFTSLLISPNGYLTFDTSLAHAPDQGYEASNFTPHSIYIFGTSMDPENFGSIKYSSIGTFPKQTICCVL